MKKLSALLLPLFVLPFLTNCAPKYYHFKFTGDHCAILGEPNYEKDIEQGATDVQFTVVPESNYSIDYEQSIIPEGVGFEDAVITIPIMDKDYHIEVKTIANEYYHFVFSGEHCTIRNSAGHEVTELDELVSPHTSKTYQLTPEADYLLPIGEIQPGIHIDQDKKLTIDKMEKNYTVSLVAHTEDTAMDIVVNTKDNERIVFYCGDNDVLIDWGDGTINEELAHTYQTGSIYTIQIHGVLTDFNIGIMLGDDENTSITSVAIYQSFEEINDSMFANCAALEAIIFPNSVLTIGEHAFDGCTSLANIIIPDGVKTIEMYAFGNCTALSTITIPSSVTSLGMLAFFGCISLTSLSIPDTVEYIQPCLILGCSSLVSITVDKNNPKYSDRNCNAIFQDITEDGIEHDTLLVACNHTQNLGESGVEHIADYAFALCDELTSINIPEGVVSIGENAFALCTDLTTVHLPMTVETIGYQAFYSCPMLESVNLPDKISIIPISCFESCARLSEIAIPDSVKKIEDCAFYGCANLTEINLPNSLVTIGSQAFAFCKQITEIYIPSSVSEINTNPFIRCSELISITVDPNNSAYYSENNTIIRKSDGVLISACSSTTSIPNDITSIQPAAFAGTKIESINIPPTVITIDYSAFEDCANLRIVDLTKFKITDSVPSLGWSVFYGCSQDLRFYFSDNATLNKFAGTEDWAEYSDKFTTDPIPTR